jgi:hypothetical protein
MTLELHFYIGCLPSDIGMHLSFTGWNQVQVEEPDDQGLIVSKHVHLVLGLKD